MAKPKQKVAKTPKKRSTKYGKLAAVCSKELTAKKAALVRAEKAFAKAQKTHTELLSEVARLDMLDRSLKALINGTEPPQNVRYVYTYPQWVWYGNPYGWWWNGNTWQVNLGTVQNTPYVYNSGSYNFQGAQLTTTNAFTTTNAANISTPICTSGALSVSSGTSTIDSGSSGLNSLSLTNCSLSNAGGLSLSSSASPGYTMTTTNGPSSSADFTVDLSTGATEDVPNDEEVADKPLPVGIGG